LSEIIKAADTDPGEPRVVASEDRPGYAVAGLHIPTAPRLPEQPPHWWIIGLNGEGGLRSVDLAHWCDQSCPPDGEMLAYFRQHLDNWPAWPASTFARTQNEAERNYLAWLSRERCK
jgi:hypothetical protein